MRRVRQECRATVGVVGNTDHSNQVVGKVGRHRWMGVRPGTRGVVMNPCDRIHMVVVKVNLLLVVNILLHLGANCQRHGVKTRDKKSF